MKQIDTAKINIVQILLKLDFGGAENLAIELANRLDRNRYRTIICSLEKPSFLTDKVNDLGIKFFSFNKRPGLDPILILKLAYLMWKEKIHLVHTHNRGALAYGTLAAKLAGVPVVINTRHGSGKRACSRILWKMNDRIVAVCQEVCKNLLKYNMISPLLVKTIVNGIDIDKYISKENILNVKEQIGLKDSELIIGTVARLSPEKDIFTLLQAFLKINQRIPKAVLVIAGDGSLRKELEYKAKKMDILDKVLFLGFYKNISELINIFDVFLLSSLNEGLPLVLIEAMAAGKPIVATKVGGVSEVVANGETGFLVPPKEPDKIAEMTITILRNLELAKKFGEAGRRRAKEKFSLNRMVNEYQNVYEECLANKRHGLTVSV